MIYSKNNRTRSGNNSTLRTNATLSMTLRIYRFIKENPLSNISQITEGVGYGHISCSYPHINFLVHLKIVESIGKIGNSKEYKIIEK